MKTLFEDVRSEKNLFSAWRHVKSSAQNSKNSKIQGQAAEFEHQHQRHLKRIASQLREGRFAFDDVEGVLQDKKEREAKNKNPRPIAIGSIKNRVVQRAILQVLQPRKIVDARDFNSKYTPVNDTRLGKLNQISCSPYGVGGLMKPYGGVRPAIGFIMSAMSQGASYFYQSDIKEFYTKIPTQEVISTVGYETKDEALTELFANALQVDLANKDELLSYASLFPSGGIGVAQGSSLSAFAGNVLLYDFDHELNKMAVSAVRYIDDLLIVSSTKEALEKAIKHSEERLGSFKFSLYPPVSGSDKAAKGECRNSFKFLGCTLQPNKCVPSKQSLENINSEIRKTLSTSKKRINELISKGKPLDPSLSRSAVLQKIGKKLYGWEKSFAFCTDAREFQKLDSDVAAKILDYENWIYRKTRKLAKKDLMSILGIPSTETQFKIDKAKHENRQNGRK